MQLAKRGKTGEFITIGGDEIRSCAGQVERAERILVDAGLVCGIIAFQRWCAFDLGGSGFR